MTFPLINYDGNKGENNDDEARLKTINHPPHWKAGHGYKNNLAIHTLNECSCVWLLLLLIYPGLHSVTGSRGCSRNLELKTSCCLRLFYFKNIKMTKY